MTKTQKEILIKMLAGHAIASCGANGFRLRSAEGHVILKVHSRTFFEFKPLLRKTKNGIFVINKKLVRQKHGNSFIKKEYKRLKANS